MRCALVTGMLVVLAAACSSSGSRSGASATSTTQAAATTTTSTTLGVTVSQVASVVAGARKDLTENAASVELYCAPLCGELGSIDQFTLGIEARTLTLKLQDFTSPPAEITSLVDDTMAALKAVSDASDDYLTCQKGGAATGTCTETQAQTLRFAALDLEDQLAAWDPYI